MPLMGDRSFETALTLALVARGGEVAERVLRSVVSGDWEREPGPVVDWAGKLGFVRW
jgi:hypothetical protein